MLENNDVGGRVAMTTSVTFLGTSDAQGVPRIACSCEVCEDSQQVRTRSSLLVMIDEETILIDVSPDFRHQFLQYGDAKRLPTHVLITHAHNDHIAGLGDYSDLCYWQQLSSTLYAPPEVIETLERRFPYIQPQRGTAMVGTRQLTIKDVSIAFHPVSHGHNGMANAIVFTHDTFKWAYMPDSFRLRDEQKKPLFGCDHLIIGTSYYHETHTPTAKRSVYDVQEAVELAKELSIQKVTFTHLSHAVDRFRDGEYIPSHAQFAYDGKTIVMIP